jgi:hypothetical protein
MALTTKTSLSGLNTGDAVWCKYTANSGAVGAFSDLATTLNPFNALPVESVTGLNYDNSKAAGYARCSTIGTDLYFVWHENNGTAYQIRARKFNGTSYSWIDGGGSTGINQDTTKAGSLPVIATIGTDLYVAWYESNTKQQIRVKKYNTLTSTWAFIDGGGATGINVDTTKDASTPKLTVIGTDLYIAWLEFDATNFYHVRVKKYNTLTSTWSLIDGGAIYYLSTKAAADPDIVAVGTDIYLTWQESATSSQIRVKKYNGSTWSWVDGGSTTGINKDTTKFASVPAMCALGSDLYVTWYEGNGTTDQIRVKKYNGSTWSWVDGGSTTGINFNTSQPGYIPKISAVGSNIYVAWAEPNTGTQYNVRVKKYNGSTWSIEDGGGYSGLTLTPGKDSYILTPVVGIGNDIYIIWNEQGDANNHTIRMQKGVNGSIPTNRMIPTASTDTPNGYFKFICVGEDYLGRKKLVADRNIQHTISWDALNTASIATGNGLPASGIITVPLGADLVPVMTSNTAPSGLAFSTSIYSGTYPAWQAFDTGDNGWRSVSGGGYPQRIGYKFTASKVIKAYTVKCYLANEAPSAWTLQASNNTTTGLDGTWTDIVTVSGQTGWAGFDKRTFYCLGNTTGYTAYRLSITASNGAAYIGLSDLEFIDTPENQYGMSAINGTNINIRLLTGGVSSADKDNEWDKIIAESTLNGNITAGDNAIWNWTGIYSHTSTRHTSSTSDVIRGSSVSGWGGTQTNLTYTSEGFRPVLLLESLNAAPTSSNALISSTNVYPDSSSLTITGSINDTDGNQVRYNVYIGPTQYMGWTSLANQPVSLNITPIPMSSLGFGDNTITINFEDSLSSAGTPVTFTVTKNHRTLFLIQDASDNKIYTVSGGAWSASLGTTITEALFISNGMADLTGVTASLISQLAQPKVLLYKS